MKLLQFNKSINSIWLIIKAANAYVDMEEPWKLNKENPKRLQTVMYLLVNSIYKITILLQPFLPNTSTNILTQLKQDKEISFSNIDNNLSSGLKLNKPIILFPKIVENNL